MRREGSVVGAWVHIDRSSGEPLAEQLYTAIHAQIARGRLRRGHRLPSTRALSHSLGISRSTVATAFDRLMANGLVEGYVGSGTYVAREAATDRPTGARMALGRAPVAKSRPGDSRPAQDAMPLLALGPTLEFFPFDTWQSLAAEQVRSMRRFSATGDPAGYEPLRIAIAEFSRRQRGIACKPSQVIVTMGATQALDLVVRTVARPGDVALIENPSDPRVWNTFANARVTALPVPVDQHGIDIDAANIPTPPPRIVSLTPVRQYPLGVTLSPSRQVTLMRHAARWNAWIVELDGTITVHPPRDPIIADCDIDSSRVIYHASLSWVLFRSLRMGYIIAPEALVPALLATRQFMDVHPPILEQAILAEFIALEHIDGYIEKMRSVNATRQRALHEAWPRDFEAGIRLLPGSAGLGNTVLLPPTADDDAIAHAAGAHGMAPVPLSGWYRGTVSPGLLLGFGGHGPVETAAAVQRLAPLIADGLRDRI